MTTVSAVSSVAERLDNLLLSEGAPARCVLDGVGQLRSELDIIEQFLSNADATNNISRDMEQKVTQLAYDIEDAVESYARRPEAAAASKGKSGGAFLSKYFSKERSLREDLHIFKWKIDELKHFMGPERDPAAAEGTGEKSSSRGTYPIVERPHRLQQLLANRTPPVLVGIGEDAERLKSLLMGEQHEFSVIAICGMGGIGKTTLARSLYNEPSLVNHFHNRAWAAVGMEFQARDILKTMLFSLASGRNKDEISGMETMELMEQLYTAQKGRRYLVVLDDVWATHYWDTLGFAFLDDNNGSRIVITTRLINLARHTSASILEMQLLTEDQSWELLQMKSGLQDDPDS